MFWVWIVGAFDVTWNENITNIADGLRQLLNRLDGPFNIEAVLEPFEVKLSEAVMMVQENQVEIDEAVGCCLEFV